MFQSMLGKHRKGVAANEASRCLHEAIVATRDTQKASTVTLTVKLKCGTDNQMIVDIQCAAKLPKQQLPVGMFWLDDDNQLCTSDPNQKELGLREVERKESATELREAKVS